MKVVVSELKEELARYGGILDVENKRGHFLECAGVRYVKTCGPMDWKWSVGNEAGGASKARSALSDHS